MQQLVFRRDNFILRQIIALLEDRPVGCRGRFAKLVPANSSNFLYRIKTTNQRLDIDGLIEDHRLIRTEVAIADLHHGTIRKRINGVHNSRLRNTVSHTLSISIASHHFKWAWGKRRNQRERQRTSRKIRCSRVDLNAINGVRKVLLRIYSADKIIWCANRRCRAIKIRR